MRLLSATGMHEKLPLDNANKYSSVRIYDLVNGFLRGSVCNKTPTALLIYQLVSVRFSGLLSPYIITPA